MKSWLMRVIPSLVVMTMLWPLPSMAHDYSSHEIQTIHSASFSEEFCTQVIDGDVNQSSAHSIIKEVLTQRNMFEDWHALAWDDVARGYKIFFFERTSACNDLSTTDYNNTEIHFRVLENTISQCGPMTGASNPEKDGVNCVFKAGSYLSNHSGHADYQRAVIYLNDSYLISGGTSITQHTINHEVGHALGFAGDLTYHSCNPDYSIMHYDCGTNPWPSALDRSTIEALANEYSY